MSDSSPKRGPSRVETPTTSDRSVASVLDCALMVAPQVAVRSERFGALLYHFGTRRLSFVKDRRLADVVQRLDSSPTARSACEQAGVDPATLAAFELALEQLVATAMVQERRP